ELAKKRAYPPALARAFVEDVLELYRVTRRGRPNEWTILTKKQWTEDSQQTEERDPKTGEILNPGPRWNPPDPGFPGHIPLSKDGFLTLDAEQAQQLDLTLADISDLNELYEYFGVPPGQVQVAGADWLDDLADFLKADWTS